MVTALAGLALASWTYLALFHGRFWRTKPVLAPAPPLKDAGRAPKIAAIIPARDEASSIQRTIQSLRRQTYEGPLRIWVVDDGSTDGTARLAEQAGGNQSAVLAAGPLQPGWTGKLWAMSRGVEEARRWSPDYLLFTDADIEHGPDSLQQLVARAETEHLDLVSSMVRLHCFHVGGAFHDTRIRLLFLYALSARDGRPAAETHRRGCRRMHTRANGCTSTCRRFAGYPVRID